MGHSTHFLERLNRVNPWHTEAALALYRDPELVREVLRRTRVPEGAPRVALALEDSGRGPHIIVSREGGFITCLGEGMEPYDVFRVSRAELDSLRELRDMISLSLKALKDGEEEILKMGGGDYFMRRLLRGAHLVNRSDIRIIRKLSPLIAPDIILGYSGRHIKMSNMRNVLMDHLVKPRGQRFIIANMERELHDYWCELWAHNHITTLFGVWGKYLEWEVVLSREHTYHADLVRDVARYGDRAVQQILLTSGLWTASRAGSFLHMIRAVWGVARNFAMIRDRLLDLTAEHIRDHLELSHRYTFGLWGSLMLADETSLEELFDEMAIRFRVKRTTLLVEGGSALPVLEETDDDAVLGLNLALIGLAASLGKESGALNDEALADCREQIIAEILKKRSTEKIRLANTIKDLSIEDFYLYWLKAHPNYTPEKDKNNNLLFMMCRAMRSARPEDLYMEDTTNPLLWPKYQPEMVIDYLKNDLSAVERHPTKHSAPRPGRNEPCPCGSGQKYKRCCALKDEAAAGDEA